jgi:hypothetical protein
MAHLAQTILSKPFVHHCLDVSRGDEIAEKAFEWCCGCLWVVLAQKFTGDKSLINVNFTNKSELLALPMQNGSQLLLGSKGRTRCHLF